MKTVASQIDISKALALPGWMTERELVWLATKARNRKFIVEFGSYLGRSTRAMADNCSGIIYAVDPWDGKYQTDDGIELMDINTYVMPYFVNNLRDHIEVSDQARWTCRVIPVRSYSFNFKLSHIVDMVFIDGDHCYETVVKDIEHALELIGKKGLICGHDYDHPIWPGVKKAVDEAFGETEREDSIWFKEF